MATKGSIVKWFTSWDALSFDWELVSQDVANNRSTIKWALVLVSTNNGAISSTARKSLEVVVGGSRWAVTAQIGIGNNAEKTLLSADKQYINHAADGTGSFNVSVSLAANISFSGSAIGTVTLSGTGSLPTIARASQPSCITWPEHTQNVGEFGDTISIHMNRQNSAFLHTVRWAFGSNTGTIARNVENGTTWTIPLSFMSQLPAATKGSGTIYVDTYYDGVLVGTKYCGFTATVPASVKPFCSLQVLDDTETKDTYGNLVQGLSQLYVKVSTSLAYGSPIDKITVTANGGTYDEAEFTTGVLIGSGTTTVAVTVTDQRGRSNSASASFPVLSYAKPSVTSLSVHRCDEDGTENEQGEFARANFSAVITALNNKNSAAYRVLYKKSTDADFTAVALANLEGKYSVSGSYIFPAASDSSYDVRVEALDDIDTAVRATSVSTAFTLMNWGANGTSVAFGKVAERANAVELGLRAYDQYGAHISNGMSLYGGSNSHIDANTTTEHLILTALNTPTSSLWYVETIFYSTKLVTSDRRQIAMPYRRGGATFSRYYTAGAWSAWESEALAAYPVGSIYIAYNHTDPGTLFGGTWARITNAFLWATTSGGTIGQTGGEREVTLTESELPVHNHGGTYTNAGTSRTHAWLTSNGSAMGYDVVSVGGGEAHNNMPPYIQVSVWRRTA